MALRKEDLNIDNITLNTKWSKWDDCYITSSKEFDVMGVGDTEEESVKSFYTLLDTYLEYEKQGKVVNRKKIGRPKKNNVKLSVNIDSDIKAILDILSIEKDINLGKIIEDIVKYYAKSNPEATYYLLDTDYQNFLDSLRQE